MERLHDKNGLGDGNQAETRKTPRRLCLSSLKRHTTIASGGLVLLFIAEFLSPGTLQNALADAAFVSLFLTGIRFIVSRGSPRPPLEAAETQAESFTWRWVTLGVVVLGVALTQTWFQSGTAIAVGDIPPPIGTAWLRTIFSSFTWSGANLGSPANNQVQLPWATVNWVTNAIGGSGALAQRVWFSILVAAILFGACQLARYLRFTPMAGAIAALLYLYNPMTLSEVGYNDVFMAAMALVPILASIIIGFGIRRLQLWQVVLLFVVSAPFIGFVYANPPLVGMLGFTTALTPVLMWLRFGRESAKRTLYGAIIGGLAAIGASAYWIIPSHIALNIVNSGRLSQISAWGFTEVRATLANAFWLNPVWGWLYNNYYSYDVDYSRFPISLIPALVPIGAFILLACRSFRTRITASAKRTAGFLTLGSLFVIFLSTGTRTPGNLLFDPLYKLPYGWLLREPGRFLIIAALGYALLSGLLVMTIPSRKIVTLPILRGTKRRINVNLTLRTFVAVIILIIAFVGAFPEWTGAIINGAQDGFPSTHVVIPGYWQDIGKYLNTSTSPRGAVMVLPADDFYQMPYTWYYGNDGFIPNLIQRHVIVPSAGGYSSVSAELINAVHLESTSLLSGQWTEAQRLLDAVGTPIVLVRGDIESTFSGRTIASPQALAKALSKDPDMKLFYSNGPLSLYETTSSLTKKGSPFTTIDSTSPDLADLSLLPRGTDLVSSKPISGHDAIFQVAPVNKWKGDISSLYTTLSLPLGWVYRLSSLNAGTSPATMSIVNDSNKTRLKARITLDQNLTQSAGSFASNRWGVVGNCDDSQPVSASDVLRGGVLPDGGPNGTSALSLSANIDSACLSKAIQWRNGPILVKFDVRTASGGPPRICLWETPINACAKFTTLVTGSHWNQIDEIVHPDRGTKAISLYLYSDALGNGETSVEEYANIEIIDLRTSPNLVVIGTPTTSQPSDQLRAFATGYSRYWSEPMNARHVIVDGMRNGWIVKSKTKKFAAPTDTAVSSEQLEEVVFALLAFLAAGLGIALPMVRKRRARDRSLRLRE